MPVACRTQRTGQLAAQACQCTFCTLHENMVSALTGLISVKGVRQQSLAACRIFAHCSRVPSHKKDPAPRPFVLKHHRLQVLSPSTGT